MVPLSPQEARLQAKQVLGRVASGEDVAERKQTTRVTGKIGDLCDEYVEANAGRIKASTLAMDKSRIEQHVKPLIGSRSVRDFTARDVEKFLQEIIDSKSAKKAKKNGRGGRTTGGPGVAGRTVSMLGTIFERAIRDGIIDRNPVRGVARPKGKPKNRHFPTTW